MPTLTHPVRARLPIAALALLLSVAGLAVPPAWSQPTRPAETIRPAATAGDRPPPTYELRSAGEWRAVAFDLDFETRVKGLVALGRLAPLDPAAVDDLIVLLDDPDGRARSSAAGSLASAALDRTAEAGRVADALADRLAAVSADDKVGGDDLVDALATVARRHPDAALPALRRAAGHPNPSVRLASLDSLLDLDPQFGPSAATDVLVGVIDVEGYAGADESDLAYPVAAASWVSGHGGPGEFASLAAPADRRRLAGALSRLLVRVDPTPASVERDGDAGRQIGYVAGALLTLGADAAEAVPTLEKFGDVEVRLSKKDGGGLFAQNLSEISSLSVNLRQVAARVTASGGSADADPRP